MKALEIIAVNLVLMQMASASPNCDSRCKGGQGICQADGRCFCWWGWTGPNATHITSGADKNRIMANYCTTACHYTHEYLNTSCARIPTPQVCSVPLSQPSQTWPCDSKCDTGSHYGRGTCLSNGRCLCWWGWTGPNACYVDGGAYNNRIIADFCANACHYNHVYRNDNCTTASPTTSPTTQPISTANPTTTIVRKERFVHYYNTGAGIVYHLDVVKDVWLERPTRNYNSFPWLIVARHPGFPNKRSLIQFENLPRRCSAAQIRSAKMYLYYLSAHKSTSQSIKTAPFIPRYLEVRLVKKYWRETEATSLYRYRRYRWSSQWLSLDGRDAEASPQRGMVTIFPSRPRGFVEFDITDAVKSWRSGTPNYGLLIRATNELASGRDIRFASNRYSDKSKHAFVKVLCA